MLECILRLVGSINCESNLSHELPHWCSDVLLGVETAISGEYFKATSGN